MAGLVRKGLVLTEYLTDRLTLGQEEATRRMLPSASTARTKSGGAKGCG